MKNRILLLIALGTLLMFGQESMAQTAIERLKNDYPAVMEQYGRNLQGIHTHYIFVIDVSGTMNKYKDDVVVPGIKNFLNTLPEGNYASIVAFGGKAAEMCTPLKINTENRKILIENLDKSYREAVRFQANTTRLDVASAKVIDMVKKDTVSDVCFAVFFSDLCDESPDWNYKNRVSELKDRSFGVVATALFADNDAQQQKGIKRMEGTFPGFAYSSNVKDVFGEKLENFKYEIYVPELKKIVRTELAKAFERLQVSSKLSISKKVELHANFDKNIPAFIKGLRVDTAILIDQSPEISQVTFSSNPKMGRFRKSCKLGEIEFTEKGELFHENPYVTLGLRYHLDTPEPKKSNDPNFIQDLEKLDIADAIYSEAGLEAKAPLVIGWNFWLFCILAVSILLYSLLFIWNTLIPHQMSGKLAVKNPLNGNTQYHFLPSKRSFTIGNSTCNLVIPGATFRLKATCRNGSPLNLLWKRRLVLTLDPKTGSGMQLTQDSKRNLKKASIRSGKEATIIQNMNTSYILFISKK